MKPIPRSYPENEILIALYQALRDRPEGLTVAELVDLTQRSEATIRRHLRAMQKPMGVTNVPWVEQTNRRTPAYFRLTQRGVEIGHWRWRARHRR